MMNDWKSAEILINIKKEGENCSQIIKQNNLLIYGTLAGNLLLNQWSQYMRLALYITNSQPTQNICNGILPFVHLQFLSINKIKRS